MKILQQVWDFLIAWGEAMEAYRKTQRTGTDFNRYI